MNSARGTSALLLCCLLWVTRGVYACVTPAITVYGTHDIWKNYISPGDNFWFSAECYSGGPIIDWWWTADPTCTGLNWSELAYSSGASGVYNSVGEYYVRAYGKNGANLTGSDYGVVWVFKMDADIGLSEQTEVDPGMFMRVGDQATFYLSYEPSALWQTGQTQQLEAVGNYLPQVKVYLSGNLIIDATDTKEIWPITARDSIRKLTVKACNPGCVLLQHRFRTTGNSFPGSVNGDTVKITVVGVDLLYYYPEILMYTGTHAAETPTQYCTAQGSPAGGTYHWECSTTGDGMLAIVSGQNTEQVRVKGSSPSYSQGDAKITVSYTLQGCTATASANVTVRRPYATTRSYGAFDQAQRTYREVFHRVFDQFASPIETAGIPCDEEVHLEWGKDTDLTSSGTTAWYEARPSPPNYYSNWSGGYAVLDLLGGWSTNHPASLYDQKIYVGGWLTTPPFNIHIQPLEPTPWPCIWKDPNNP